MEPAEPDRPRASNVRVGWNLRGAGVFFPRRFFHREEHMFTKYITAGVAASALLASVAFAQNPPASTNNTTPEAKSSSSYQGDWRASKLVGLNVYNNNNENIGSISDILTDKSGSIKAVVIGVGGFLGMGEHLVAMPFDQVKFVDEPVASNSASSGAGTSGSSSSSGNTANRPSTTTGSTSSSSTSSGSTGSTKNPWYPDHAVVNSTKDQLKGMTEFKYSS
jgi:sporulation protein YlmC with PRC-barrel domain